MALGCGAKCLKYCLFAFNLVFVIGGIVCLGVGIWLIADKQAADKMEKAMEEVKVNSGNSNSEINNYKQMPNSVRNVGIVLAAGGAIILVIAFLGCCGAVKEWRPLLVLYAIFLMIILAVEIAIAIYVAVNKDTFDKDFKGYMADTLKVYTGNDSYPTTMDAAWDLLMNTSKCCGVDPDYPNQRGFGDSAWYKQLKAQPNCPILETVDTIPYPKYCCKRDANNAPVGLAPCGSYNYCVKAQIQEAGCYQAFKGAIDNKMAIIIGVGVAVGLVQLIGILFAFCLCCSISNSGQQ